MNAEERRLISDLFARLRGTDVGYRDPDAEAFIRSEVSSIPHAPYAMTQTLVVQNQALEQAQARIAELERQLDQQQAEPARGGFGGGYEQPGASPWGPRASEAMGAPAGAGAATANRFGVPNTGGYGQPQPGGAPFGQQAAPSRGGGFLSGALQTAAGVAGGALLFSGISSLFGGGQAEAAASEAAKAAEPAVEAPAEASAHDANADGGDGGWFSGLLGGGDDGGDAGGDDGDWA